MKAAVILLFLFICSCYAHAQETKLIRMQLLKAVDNSRTTDSLYNALREMKDPQPVIIAYLGTLEALKAKHAWNPYYKFKFLNNAEQSFNKAVIADKQNIEIRFMRFSVESNLPGFLGYDKNLEADKDMIITQIDKKAYKPADKNLMFVIDRFLVNSKKCSLAQVNDLDKQLAELR